MDGLRVVRGGWRLLLLVGVFAQASVELLVTRPRGRKERSEWLHRFCARGVRRLGLRITVRGRFPESGAMVSNHLSYLDIVVYSALHPCVFVSKAEIAGWPVLGWLTTQAGTVYVERGRGGSALRAREAMRVMMGEGIPVVFFPEGTTSTGDGVLAFHSGVLGQVLGAGPVTAAFVRYRMPAGQGATVREDVHFWGETPMLGHIWRFLQLRGVEAEVCFGEGPVGFSDGGVSRKVAAVEARRAVCGLGGVDAERVVRE